MAALLAVAMMFQMLPLMAFADEGTSSTEGKAWVNGTEYSTLLAAVEAAHSGDTIELDEGDYTLCGKLCDGTLCGKPSCNVNPPHGEYEDASKAATKDKKLTFVGKGERTVWNIGLENPRYDGERNGDYSFDGADTVTFKNMTLDAGVNENYRGFIRPNNTIVENCVINGRTAYWGYKSAVFENTTFNAPGSDYAIWTYSSSKMTFDHCTFNADGRVINVFKDGSEGDVTVNFQDCTVNSSRGGKPALKIDDSTMVGNHKYTIKISGNNTVNAGLDYTTCSRVFGYGTDTGRTEVYVNGEHVWGKKEGADKGELKTHKYSAGEAEHKVTTKKTEWRQWDERNDERDVNRKCQYCGREENYTERASVYRLQYDLNGGTGAEGADYNDAFYHEKENFTLAAAPSREGYDFVGWKDAAGNTYSAKEETVLKGDTVLTAQWADPANGPILTVEGGTITAKKDGAELTLNIQEVGNTQKTAVPAGAEVTVELNKDAIPQNMNFDRWTLDGWTLDDEMLKNELDAALNQETIKFTMPTHDLSVEAVYQGTAGDSGDSSIIGTVVIGAAGAALLGWGTYQLGTECLKKYYGLPYFPSNRSVLAMMLWEDAGKPMPESELLYPDVGQEERDMDLQHAARWAMENELFPDLNDEGTAEEERKFYPDNTVSKISVLRAWRKAQELKQKA